MKGIRILIHMACWPNGYPYSAPNHCISVPDHPQAYLLFFRVSLFELVCISVFVWTLITKNIDWSVGLIILRRAWNISKSSQGSCPYSFLGCNVMLSKSCYRGKIFVADAAWWNTTLRHGYLTSRLFHSFKDTKSRTSSAALTPWTHVYIITSNRWYKETKFHW